MNPKVSICIPTYKQNEHLKKCLDSILLQDFEDFELIISDDTPDDSIENFIKEVLKGKDYTYFHHSPSLGSPANWNYAISKAKGKYIKIMHHDDFFTQKNSLSLMYNKIKDDQSSFLFCQTDVWYTQSNSHRIQQASEKQIKILKKFPEFLFFKNVIGAPSTSLFLNDNYKFDNRLKWLVDVDFYISILKKQSFSYLPLPLICTSHDIVGQTTGEVLNDKSIQIKEHVLLFNKLNIKVKHLKGFAEYFDYLFFQFQINSFSELINIVYEASDNKAFFEMVINNLGRNRAWKNFKKKLYGSRYNNYLFKFEQYI